ncbi:hypothetical protein JG687_00003202 [Phytophthora cactorum]|uniref:Uncharacterized protein n=1 Tax=Phytophthora cactorum TaxID=29920 RepID=A0A8T1UWD3_9STRA|nr:hypothetical protein JG687_00003202 [Phytophthora cactorum]
MTDKFLVDLTKASFSGHLNNNSSAPTDAVPEELRCQYSSKRCENQRTHKKSGGLHKMQRSPVGVKPMSPPNMMISMNMPMQAFQTTEMQTQQQPQQQQPTPNLPLFDQNDLEILEALLFSSDEEQNDAVPVTHCSSPQLFRAPSFVNV